MSGGSGTATTGEYRLALSCAVCASQQIAGVCHHCALPFCREHLPSVSRPWWRIDPEYRGLELSGTDADGAAVHCRRHMHQRFNWHPFYRSAAMFIFALLFPTYFLYRNALDTPPALFGLYLLAAGLFMLAALADYRGERASEPPLPLGGRSPSLALREFAAGTLRLAPGGTYRAEVTRAAGQIAFSLAPDGSEDRRRKALQRRYHLRSLTRLRTSAGFLALQGKAALAVVDDGRGVRERRPHIIALAEPGGGHPFFPLDGNPEPYTVQPQYEFTLDGGLPLRLLPALVSSENDLGLELAVQLLGKPPHALAGADVVVTELVLCAPPELGDLRSVRPAAAVPDEDARCEVSGEPPAVCWRNVELVEDAEAPPGTGITSGHHRTFFARFARGELLPHTTLTGSLKLRVEQRLLSGVSGATLFSPLGWHRDDLSTNCHTEMAVNFELSLHSLLATAPLQREREREYDGPVSYRQVLDLARQLNRSEYYVKRLVEHTAAAGNRRASPSVERAWTVAGRCYQGIFPVEFELNVSSPDRRAAAGGRTHVQMRADARASRGPSLAALQASIARLEQLCDEVFGAGAAANPAAEQTAPQRQPDTRQPDMRQPDTRQRDMPPGHDQPRREPEPPPGL